MPWGKKRETRIKCSPDKTNFSFLHLNFYVLIKGANIRRTSTSKEEDNSP